MDIRTTALLLVAALVLAGCVGAGEGDSAAPSDEAPGVPDASDVFPVDLSAEGCDVAVFGRTVPKEEAQALLPDGFVAADYSDAVWFVLQPPDVVPDPPDGADPISTVYVILFDGCDAPRPSLSVGLVAVLIEPPNPPGVELPGEAMIGFYALEWLPDADMLEAWPELAAAFEAAGVSVLPVDVDAEISGSAGDLREAVGRLADADGAWFEAEGLAPRFVRDWPSDAPIRAWTQTPQGLLVVDLTYYDQRELWYGPPGSASCSARAGTTAAHVFGSTECPPNTRAILQDEIAFHGSLLFFEGAHAET